MKIDKVIFSMDDNPIYADFWPIQADLVKTILKAEPVLFHITDKDSDFYFDGHGTVKKINKNNCFDIISSFQSQVVRMYGTKYFQNEVCITADIDMLMINEDYFLKQIENINDESLVIMDSKAYDLERVECQNHNESCENRYPICYIVGKGKNFNKILNTDRSFEHYVDDLQKLRLGWGTDELYFGSKVDNTNHDVNIVKLVRNYTTPWRAEKRIDRHNFPTTNLNSILMDSQKRDGIYDINKLKSGYYIDAHCPRPYNDYKKEINELVEIIKKIKLQKNMTKKIDLFKVFMAPTAADEVGKVLNSGYIGQGPKVEEFEKQLKTLFNHDYVSTVNAGTSALHLALRLLKKPNKNQVVYHGVASYDSTWPGLEDGDEVLATPMTCTASNWPILANNLKIKWVDIDPTTLNMDLDDLARKITPKTKVIMLVHWGGYPNDLDKIKQIQENSLKRFGFKPAVIEDGAHSFGSEYKGKMIGSHGNLTMFSLQAIKHITSIDGGLLLSPYKELHRRAKLLRWYGIDREGDRKDFRCEADVEEWGYKFHMNDVCATVGIENLKHFKEIVGKHRDNASFYDKNLIDTPGVTLLKREEGHDSAFWIYSMLVENRDGFYKWMNECGISVSQVHERNDKHTCVHEFRTSLPSLDKTIGKIVSIPVGWWVTKEDREYIVECIKKGW